jgi:O-antigen/teichoic acid export membrane protein
LLLGLVFSLPTGPKLIIDFATGRMLISLGVAAAICTLVTVSYKMLTKRSAAGGTSPNPNSRLLRQALPFLVSDIAISVYLRADLIIISFALGSVGAAVYGPALNLVNMCFLVPFAFNILVLPRLSRAYVEAPHTFMRLGRSQLAVQAATGTLMALALWALSNVIIDAAFGPNYSSSAAILRILSPLVALKACSFGLGNILTAANRQSERTGIQISVAAFNVLANLAVVRTFGIPGVAVVYACSELLLCGGYALLIRRISRGMTERTSPLS